MNNIQVLQHQLYNNNLVTMDQIKKGLTEAKNSISSKFFISASSQQKKDNIQKILNALNSNDNNFNDSMVGPIEEIFRKIILIKSPQNLSNKEELIALHKLIQEYLGNHRAKRAFVYFYKIKRISTNSLKSYNNIYKEVIVKHLKDSIKVNNLGDIINIDEFYQLCSKYRNLLDVKIYKKLFIELIDDYFNNNKLNSVIILLNFSKKILHNKDYKFYKNMVLKVFIEINDSILLEKFLLEHRDFIDFENFVKEDETIVIDKYLNTNDIQIAFVICKYLTYENSYIVLPPRRIIYLENDYKIGNDTIYNYNTLFYKDCSHNKMVKSDIESIIENKIVAP
jgi:hypothetical protein